MTSQLPLARPSNRPIADKSQKHYPHNHLQSLLDGFVDFSGVENCTTAFKGLSLNSKKIHEDYLFLACAGVGHASQHGIAYAGEAINLGASCIAWEPTTEVNTMPATCPVEKADAYVDVPLIQVEALHEKVGEIASRFYQHPSRSLNVIGITGTNGKTSTAHFIAQLIHDMEAVPCSSIAVIGTLGNGFYGQLEQSTHTTPDAVTLQELIAKYRDAQAETLVMEVSSHALSQGRVNGVAFDCAIFTNLTRDHLDYHGDMKSYADEKLKLFHFSSLKQVIVNQDDAFADVILDSLKADSLRNELAASDSAVSESEKVSLVGYSQKDKSADFYASDIQLSSDGISFALHVKEAVFTVKTHLVGDFNVENLLAAIAALHSQGYEINTIVANVEKLTVVPGRMEKIILAKHEVQKDAARADLPLVARADLPLVARADLPLVARADLPLVARADLPLIVVDYAHTPDALDKALCALKAHTKGKLICLFGCGGDRDKGKRPLMAKIAQQQADRIVVTSDNPRTESAAQIIEEIISGFDNLDNVVTEIDREKAIHLTLQSMTADDVVLIAGKGHEDYQEINGQRLPFSDKDGVLSFYMKGQRH